MQDLDMKLVALHKHWITADAIQYHMRRSIGRGPEIDVRLSPDIAEFAQAHSAFLMLSVWYGLLYVVIEGYQNLGLSDAPLDTLLSDLDRVSALRRFRNATFHYQEDPISKKIIEFLDAPESEIWINNVNRALKNYFESMFNIENTISALKDGSFND